jgi:hypothetical protein
MFPSHDLHPLASLYSDHAPLLFQTDASFISKKRFHFKSFWPKCEGFLEVVQRAWSCPLRDANPFKHLNWLLRNTAKVLKSWNDRTIGSI